MAARWRGKDRSLNAGNPEYLTGNTLNEMVLTKGEVEGMEMDAQSVMDRSILAILEDSTVTSEDKSRVEDESETTLLSALSEILDSVEDDDGTLSPFDTLPDAELLTHQDHRDNSPLRRLLSLAGAAPDRDPVCYSPKSSSLSPSSEESIADRLRRPRLGSLNVVFTERSDGEDGSKGESDSLPLEFIQPSQKSHHSTNSFEVGPKKAETEIEVFTSTSLVNLVNIMHPYCLRLRLEEEGKGWVSTPRKMSSSWGKPRKDHTLSSQGEIWKYEKPSGDSDEEINVDVSDDETKEEEEGDEKRVDAKLLKSVLLNRDSSRAQPSKEKKRVSFGPVQVASFDVPMEKESNVQKLVSGITEQTSEMDVSAPLTSTKTPETPAGPAPEPLTTASSEINSDKAEVTEAPFVLLPQGETKAKSLSLQQYRQLRQKRLPLVEKQGNYTTKWPSLSEPPKELTPILGLQGQRHNRWGPKMTHDHPIGTGVGTDHFSGSKTSGCKTSSSRVSLPPRPDPVETKPSNHVRHGGLKRPRTESKIISPASPLSSLTAAPIVNAPENRKSPEKKPTLLSSDPPNPVLLPLPVTQPPSDRTSQPASPSTAHSSPEPKVVFLNRDSSLESTRLLQEIQKKFSTQHPNGELSSLEPKSKVLLLNQDPNPDSTTLLQEVKNTFSKQPSKEELLPSTSPAPCPTTTQAESISECKKPPPRQRSHSPTKETKLLPKIPQSPSPDLMRQTKCPSSMPYSTQPPAPVNAPIPVKETLMGLPLGFSPPEEPPSPPQLICTVPTPAGDSGIEAPDLTSLLEQFEETQAKDENKCESDLDATPEAISEACDQARRLESSCSSSTVEMLGLLSACLLNIEKPLCSSGPDPVRIAELVDAPQSPNLQTLKDLDLDTTPTAGPEILRPSSVEPLETQNQESFSTSETPSTSKTLRIVPPLQMLESVDIPEPLGTDIILSTQDRAPANQQRKLFSLALQRKQPATPKTPPSKAIQIIDPRPLPSKRTHTSPLKSSATKTSSEMLLSVFSDHDYCAPVNRSLTSATLCSKTQTSTPMDISNLTHKMQVTTRDSSTTSECKKRTTTCEVNTAFRPVNNSEKCVRQRLSEDQSTRPETDLALPFSDGAMPEHECGLAGDAKEDRTKPCSPPTPPPSPPGRGREKRVTRRYRRTSPRSDSSSSSPSSSSCSSSSSSSCSPQRKRLHRNSSESSSCSSSPSRSISRSPPRRYRLSYSRSRSSRSRSTSWSQSRSRSRSPSPRVRRRRRRDVCSPTCHRNSSRESRRRKRRHEMRIQKLRAIDERRVVYVGRIRRSMTHDDLRDRFSLFGEVECVSLHFRDRGDNYGFVTFYNMDDAFAAIENGNKVRRPDELPFDICFGGRRQFCKSNYADLDSNRDVDPAPTKSRFEDLDFDSLLKQAQKGLKR
ncbi:uncharacterized protein LOC139924297 [Centroberyx gerrardi]